MGMLQSSVVAMAADKHIVIPCLATDSEDLFEYVDCESPDVIVADIDTHPWLLYEVKNLRRRDVTVPVVGIASTNCLARGERRADFLEIGGNDLLEKPVHHRELMASMDSLYRLYSKGMLGRTVYVRAGTAMICLDVSKHRITVDDTELTLSTMQYKLLELFIVHKGQALNRKKILNSLYGFLDIPENNSIEVTLTRLRKKMSVINPDATHAIETIRLFGYRLNENPT